MEKGERTFDGVLCFGGVDWWYHNRGHYDVQIMRRLAEDVPVIYVNSLGMRIPKRSEGSMFFSRVKRKVKSWARGAVPVTPNFTVFSPVALPGRAGRRLSQFVLTKQLQAVLRDRGIRRPLVWVACPTAAPVVDALDPAGVVFQRTDRFEAFGGVDSGDIGELCRGLVERADLSLYCCRSLMDAELPVSRASAYVDHGLDEVFGGADDLAEPDDIASIEGPRVGFIGGVDHHTFDAKLFREMTARVPEATFVLVGGRSIPDEEILADNVVGLGRKPLADVPAYMAACDVLIMPWNRNEWIDGCHPVKLKEYLAVGRPIVSTPFPELESYPGLVSVAADAESFADAVRAGFTGQHDPQPGYARVTGQSWAAKVDDVRRHLAEVGLVGAGVS